ncbi:MAG: hypothetical protein H6765_07745 [Candidatus Peribacteria bacterium]|nr:MAG: hypothetical protein H6765_07745 [Candidatus Peribacteria bacterium]
MPQRMEYELQARMLADGSEESIVIVAAGVNDVHPGNRLRGQQSTQQEFLDGVQSCIAIAQSYGCKVLVL